MEHVHVPTAQNVGLHFEAAGLGDRTLAALIDVVLVGAYLAMAGLTAALLESPALGVLLFLPAFTYHLLCEVTLGGQSVGKRLRGLKVVRLDGTAPTLGNYLVRWLLRLLEVDVTMGLVATATALVNGRGQRLGDLAAGTTLVRVTPRVTLDDTLLTPLEADYTPTYPAAERLTPEEAALARDVLHGLYALGRTHDAAQMGKQMTRALESRLDVQADLPPEAFLRTLLRDYNHLHGRV